MIRTYVVDDHAIVRDGLQRIIEGAIDLRYAGSAGSAQEFLQRLPTLECDVVILDYSMPGGDGAEVLRQVRELRPRLGVIIYSMHPEGAQAARLIRAGAASYLSKSRPVSELLEAIRRVAALGRYVVPELHEQVRSAADGDVAVGPMRLSEREHQIFLQLVDGFSPADIGANLSLASSTVSTHIRRIEEDKLEVETVAQLVHLAVKWGLR